MVKTNTIKKVVNGEIADGDDVNQIVENAGAEGGSIPYDDTTQQRATNGQESLGAVAFPWGGLFINRDAALVEVDPVTNTIASSVTFSALRKFIQQKDTPNSYAGQTEKFVRVKTSEDGVEFSDPPLTIPTNIQSFTSGGTWTRPVGIDKVLVKVWSSGAGGAGASSSAGGGGGGGGGYAEGIIDVSGNVTIVVGAGGAGGSNGNSSSFAGDTTISATGGTAGSGATGGAGGTGSNGDINLTGATGGNGATAGNNAGRAGGGGGGAALGGAGGGPGPSGSTGIVGAEGTVPGGAGGGGGEESAAGGPGADGLVIVIY